MICTTLTAVLFQCPEFDSVPCFETSFYVTLVMILRCSGMLVGD